MTVHLPLDGKTALVTGASRGIGRACALALAEAGARVVAVARGADDLALLASLGDGRIQPWVADVADASFHAALTGAEPVDILVNNVGSNQPEPFAEVTAETLDQLLGLNVRTAFLVAQAAVRAMLREQRPGVVIHMSSQMGQVGSPKRSVYCTSKHAIEGLSKAMAVELAPHGIRSVTIAPTFVETPLTAPMLADPAFRSFVLDSIPLARLATPEEIAAAVVFLASPGAAMITGSCLTVDGGWTAR